MQVIKEIVFLSLKTKRQSEIQTHTPGALLYQLTHKTVVHDMESRPVMSSPHMDLMMYVLKK